MMNVTREQSGLSRFYGQRVFGSWGVVEKKEDWALAVGGGRVRGTGSSSSSGSGSSMWGEGSEKVEELQR